MRRNLCITMILLLVLSLSGCSALSNAAGNGEEDKAAITALVEAFGGKIQLVSLLAPDDIVAGSIEENYKDFVTSELLEKWTNDPSLAPGRTVSSPWPDRIEIGSIEQTSKGEYSVVGEIVEVTSVEKEQGGAAAKRPIVLAVVKADSKWLIDDIELGEYADGVVYKNAEYGFSFILPESWEGYSVVTDEWKGLSIGTDGEVNEEPAETGPIIRIRHPEWTAEEERQDIPIMVFTLAQWESMEDDGFHIGAAPMNPTELARSKDHVFALPARYNYSFPEGFEEVEEILAGNPIRIP